ncbi:MAG TPA: UDP-3-O-(3-hydroxymyristoyl)glucosamine N-acyltransferase [Solimonas sp.]|nr:UDP-3-O-(3-hydroxymyristoyl)glucosamine N-acyltransferase [Solimonas sp.]
MHFKLSDLAEKFGLELKGEGATEIHGICTLAPGKPGRLGFLANPKYRSQLGQTLAGAVIVGARDVAALKTPALVAKDPYLAFARIGRLFDGGGRFEPGVHASAVVAPRARVAASAHLGPHVSVLEGAQVGEHVHVGAGSVIGRDAIVGDASFLDARVVIGERVRLGARCRINPGAVIGGRGFGLARAPQGWEEVPQLGSVLIGDDVEIGANSCVDRGAIEDTVIEDGVKIDNLVQIAHNVRIGAHTAIAGCAGIAGSSTVGARCMIGGAAVIGGHLTIADDVVILGRAMVTRSLTRKGVYGSGLPVDEAREWRRTVARVKRLGRLEERLEQVEAHLKIAVRDAADDHEDDV